ncbi:unnamed protein product [Acanthosepion pharaonis]|uniref:Uncharacterized protein n=1 Tax=Acanthosepion pharaonis TaxID=158019 RepID=A0A812DEW0_ACAPH|nr:unnamed protein product [Sepia pharaonis]
MTVISQNGLRMLDVGIVNQTTMITTSIDANLRIWNCARKFQEPETKVSFEQIRHGSVQDVKFLPNPRYLLFMIGFGPFYWYVYDVTTCEILMELQLINGNAMAFPLSNTQIAAVSQSCKLKIVDLETCSITKVFKGKVHPTSCFLTIKNGKEILTTSCCRRNLKVYDTEAGQIIKTMQGVSQNISHISINKSENIALAFTEGDCVLIVDMLQYEILHIMNPKDIEFCNSMLTNQEAVQVSSDGTLLILMVKKYLDINRTDNIFSTVLWNITQENVHCHMFDKEYHERYKDFAVEMNADVESATFMQEDQVVLSTHDDYIIRVFSTASDTFKKHGYGNTIKMTDDEVDDDDDDNDN